jgi:tubulin polyglutamylase TTLL6/13
LIDGLKFDLRIYALILGCDPLRIFVHEEGLVRFATEKYVAPKPGNLSDVCKHLTNYAINKVNPNFIYNTSQDHENVGHKWSLAALYSYLQENQVDVD